MTDLSVIIVSFNTRELLRDCLVALLTGCDGLSVEVFVVDNASSDGSVDMVREEFPNVQLVCNERNVGFAAANNIALKKAGGRYLLLLNSDTRVGHDALPKLVGFMDQAPTAGYCGPRLLNADGTHQPSARRFPTALSTVYSMTGLSHRFPHSRHTLDLHIAHGDDRNFRAGWVSGACLMVRAEPAGQVGVLDEGFFMYFEETDWCKRMESNGWEGWYVSSGEVVHLGGQSVGTDADARPFSGDHPEYWVKSSRRYMRRHLGLGGTVVSVLLQVMVYALTWGRHCWRGGELSRRKSQNAAAAIRYLMA